MIAIETVSLTVFLGAMLVLAGILSSLVALRFGAPLLLVFLLIGMLAGESGPGGIRFNDVHTAYLVGSMALALILFDGGLRTRFQSFRTVFAPSLALATLGVLISALLTAPAARYLLGLDWTQAVLLSAVVSSTDAAAVFFLLHSRGLRLRPRVGALLEIESGTNDPFAILLTIMLVEVLLVGHGSWGGFAVFFLQQAALGTLFGLVGGHAIVQALNRLGLPQGLHAPFVTTSAVAVFGLAQVAQGSGFLAVYVAGLIVGNRPTRAHNTVIVFLDAATWLSQIVMFVLLGLLVWPSRLVDTLLPALGVAVALMMFARPVAIFTCLWSFRFALREKLFISWVGLRGAVSIFLASIPLLVGLPQAQLYFDVGFIVVLVSLLVQGWTVPFAARRLGVALRRSDLDARRVELDLPGQLTQELVGYNVGAQSPYLRRRLVPSWARLMFVVRDQRVLTSGEASEVRENDYAYFLAPPERAAALDRFFADMPPAGSSEQRAIGDFFLPGDVTLGAVAEVYGLDIEPEQKDKTLTDVFAARFGRAVKPGDPLSIGPIVLLAHTVAEGLVTVVGLQLAELEPPQRPPQRGIRTGFIGWLRARARR